ncbi:AraC family transcriptional regulator [Proteinivorax tanatarense]|uniref:AraC family transcriptional regulator n=1 Tax=Proteinivorax tanatarense TaxID=1260629 RepID=A0AAU7VJW4_9FIRM
MSLQNWHSEINELDYFKKNLFNNQKIIIAKRKLPYRVFLRRIVGMEFTAHNLIELLYVLKGTVEVSERNRVKILNQGELYIINANKAHSIYSDSKDNIMLVFQIKPSYLKEISGITQDSLLKSNSLDPTVKDRIVYALGLLFIENINAQSKYEVHLSRLKDLINNLKDCLFKDDTFYCKGETDTIEQIIFDIVEEKSCSIEEDLSLEKMAMRYNVSYSYLSRVFKKITGENFTQYSLKQKLNKAVDLLLNTNETVSKISISSGFADVKLLNKDFRKILNMSPTDFRRKYNCLDKLNEENTLLDHYSVRDFLKKTKKERIKRYNTLQIEDKKYKIGIKGAESFNTKEKWCKIIELEDIVGDNLDNLEKVLTDLSFEFIIIKFHLNEGEFCLKKEDKLQYIPKMEVRNLVNVLTKHRITPVLQIGLDFHNQCTSTNLNDKHYLNFKSAIDFLSMIIGTTNLEKWKFELNISGLMVNFFKQSIEQIEHLSDILISKFGTTKNIVGVYIGPLSINMNKEEIKYVEDIRGMLDSIGYLRMDINCFNSYLNKQSFVNLSDCINTLIEQLKVYLHLENSEKLICTFNYIVDDRDVPKKYDFFYYNIFVNFLLLNINHDNFYVSLCKIEDEACIADNYPICNILGIKLTTFYILKFIEELKTNLVWIGDGCVATRDGNDIAILVFTMYREWENIQYSFSDEYKDREMQIALNIKNIFGKYKITEYKVSYENNTLYQYFSDNLELETVSEEEKLYIQNKAMPEIKIKVSNIEESFEYITKKKFLGISLIKMEKV